MTSKEIIINSLYIEGCPAIMKEILNHAKIRLGNGINALEINPPEPIHEDD